MSGAEHVAVFTAAGDSSGDALRLPWDEAAWRKLLQRTDSRRFRAGEIVIQRGAMERELYFVASGSLEIGVYRAGAEGAGPIARIGAGSVVGEQSFFDALPRSVNVWANSDGELLRFTREAFEAFARDEPALARDLLFALGRVLSVRLRNATLRGRSTGKSA